MQSDPLVIFRQEVEAVNERHLSKTTDQTVRVVFSKPAAEMSYDDYVRDYLRAMLREQGVSGATDLEINRFQAVLKEVGGDNFGVEGKAEQSRMTERYRRAQTSNRNERDWGTSEYGRAVVLAGAGQMVRERAAAGGARLGEQQQIGQQKATEMAFDVPKVYARAAIKTGQDLLNTTAEMVDPSIKTDPHNWTRAKIGEIMDAQLPTPQNGARQTALPRVDASPIMPDYNSDLFNRDVLTGEVNKDGITVGKLTETAVELAAPTIAGKVAAPVKAPQTLESVGALPKTQASASSNVFKNVSSEATPFDPLRLQKIQANLEKRGVAFVTGEEGERLAAFYGAEALYIPDFGRPGIIVLGRNPSTTAVVEELIHLGQHRRLGWGDISGKVPKLEVEAQEKLLKLGEKLGWSQDEMDRIKRAMEVWRKQQ